MALKISSRNAGLIGLDITATSVKLLELKPTKKGFKVVSYTVEPLPANAVNEKNLQDVEAVGEAIRRAVKRSGTRTKACAVAVPSAMVITKVIQMDDGLKDHEMDAQIQFLTLWKRSIWISRYWAPQKRLSAKLMSCWLHRVAKTLRTGQRQRTSAVLM